MNTQNKIEAAERGPFKDCAYDQKPVRVDGLGSALSESSKEGKVFFCSEECRQAWIRRQQTGK